jgi:glucan phosphorylase
MSMSLLSQTIEYPRYEVDSLGQKVVVMTIEQAQKLDNDTDLLALFEKLDSDLDDYDSLCVKVIAEKDVVIAQQTVQINQLKELNKNKDAQIDNLLAQINDYKNKEIGYIKEIANKNEEINLHLDKIREQKIKMIVGGGLGGLVIIGLVIAIIAN